jgi:predicted transposase/invertase (TIGR01784 family)
MPSKIPNIHDKFIKELLADKEIAISFLESYLPSDLLKDMDLSSMVYLKTSYITKKLKESFSDIVWQFKTHHNQNLNICLLLEHKSHKDEMVVFQILEYLALGYQQQIKEKKKIELIVPVLYYHGKEKWELKPFGSYFDKYRQAHQKYIPDYRAEFINLQNLSKDELVSLQNGLLRSAMLIQRHYFDSKQIQENFENIVNSIAPYLEKNLSYTIFVYLIQFIDYDKTILNQQLESFPNDINNKIMSLYDQLIAEGIEKGRNLGIEEGIEKGIEKGRHLGIEEGIEKGVEKTVLNAFDNHIALDTIRLITGESLDKINAILKQNGRI